MRSKHDTYGGFVEDTTSVTRCGTLKFYINILPSPLILSVCLYLVFVTLVSLDLPFKVVWGGTELIYGSKI